MTDNQQDITTTPSPTTEDNNYIQILKTTPMFSKEQSLYPFNILKSRKKERETIFKKKIQHCNVPCL